MKTLGKETNKDILSKMVRIDTLIYFEGSLLELYIDRYDHDKYYFCRWVDDDEYKNRWLVYDVDKESLLAFFNKEKCSLDLIKSAISIYLFDSNQQQNILYEINYHSIPAEYLPERTVFFDDSTYTSAAKQIRISLLKRKETSQQTLVNMAVSQIVQTLSKKLEHTEPTTDDSTESHYSNNLSIVPKTNYNSEEYNKDTEKTRKVL